MACTPPQKNIFYYRWVNESSEVVNPAFPTSPQKTRAMTCSTRWVSSSVQNSFKCSLWLKRAEATSIQKLLTIILSKHCQLTLPTGMPHPDAGSHFKGASALPDQGAKFTLFADPFKPGLMPDPAFRLTFSFCYNYTTTLSKTSTSVAVKSQTSKNILCKPKGTSSYPL